MAKTVGHTPLDYSRDSDDIEIYIPFSGKKKPSSSNKKSDIKDVPEDPKPKPSTPEKNKDKDESSSKPKSSAKTKAKKDDAFKQESQCQDPNCEMCQALKRETSTNNRPKFVVVDGDHFAPPSRDEPKSYKKIPEKVPDKYSGDAKPKYNFTKKMGQLDAAIKLLTTKVEEKIMKEKYSAADDLQNALNNLKETKIELMDLLEDREKELDDGNLKGAQTLKDEYDEKLSTINLDSIRHHLTPDEFQTLKKLKK
uniref:Uncharacterized protein n=1 Tax=Acrobeloides nanus TaxID=290746 RepID=A0A914DJY4_9BILA